MLSKEEFSRIFELAKGKPPLIDMQSIVGKYYQKCNATNPPKTYLAMEIAEVIAQAQRDGDIRFFYGGEE
ncbi:hypothetical protein LCGC14_1409190 [marine sediment metagenome]|uniref:Uncharacterized protein n=1 Tax=marine sediment metagenome TaxID=412755 RepID=A0A0F9JV26_9ZZZZ